MDRRQLLVRGSVAAAGAGLALGASTWSRVLAAPVQPGDSPYGPLSSTPDANGMLLPEGFTSRVIARANTPVAGTSYVWHRFPDGSSCIAASDGGWILVSNSEDPPPALDVGLPQPLDAVPEQLGGAGAIRFSADADIVDAYSILTGSRSNCAGGLTPWGTWLSCEEWDTSADPLSPYDGGKVWECDPFGDQPAVDRPALGRWKHEMAAIDPVDRKIYLSEDQEDGLFYRFTPATWGDLSAGAMHAAALDASGNVTWVPVTNAGEPAAPLRETTAGATPFDGGEGVVYDIGRVYLTTKNDDRVWVLDIAAQRMTVLYDAADSTTPILNGVDNIIVSRGHDLYVAEDGGNLEVCIITPDNRVAPVLRMTGPQHGTENPTPVPLVSEVSGLAFNPAGDRLYFNSQRGFGSGITYEMMGPFRGSVAAQQPPPTTSTPPIAQRGTLPATGGGSPLALLGAGAAAAAALALRSRELRR